jgi:hypothetical protein
LAVAYPGPVARALGGGGGGGAFDIDFGAGGGFHVDQIVGAAAGAMGPPLLPSFFGAVDDTSEPEEAPAGSRSGTKQGCKWLDKDKGSVRVCAFLWNAQRLPMESA